MLYLVLKMKKNIVIVIKNGCIENTHVYTSLKTIFKKYKTFSMLIFSYINTSGNWKNEKLGGNTTPAGQSVFTQFFEFF